jgi:D-glycero-D-manno-heptose 1,7-bisphosphate phosphatase
MIKAAFLDRDGIVNLDTGYVHRKEDFTFTPGIFDLCRVLLEKDYGIIIITNQSGIARGMFTLEDFTRLTRWMVCRFREQDIPVLKVYFCPHHPSEGKGDYRIACSCRKPAPGMIFQARKEFGLVLEESMVIGDKPSDILAGINAGISENYLISPDIDACKELNPCRQFSSLDELADALKGSDE